MNHTAHTAHTAEAFRDGHLHEVSRHVFSDILLAPAVAFTAQAWEDCVLWSREDNQRKALALTADMRLTAVMFEVVRAILDAGGVVRDPIAFTVERVPRPDAAARTAYLATLVMTPGVAAHGGGTLTISLASEG